MTKNYAKFLPFTPSQRLFSELEILGWQTFFAQQTSLTDLRQTPPVRVMEVHRGKLVIQGENIHKQIPTLPDATVGDWILLNKNKPQNSRILERKSVLKRRAPGKGRQIQLIAANIETVFIVSSCNQDFNIARLERYIAVAFEADITPVIILTKQDLSPEPDIYLKRAGEISDTVPVIILDARNKSAIQKMENWCKAGETIAFLGSSGVGKSTLSNALTGVGDIQTQKVRESDSKGRHTTTTRKLYPLKSGGLVLDMPGMRELQLVDIDTGIDDVFTDLYQLAVKCRFKNCHHEGEPGCAISNAIEKGLLAETRLLRWRKLISEQAFNTASLSERRSKDKAFGKMVRHMTKNNIKRNWNGS